MNATETPQRATASPAGLPRAVDALESAAQQPGERLTFRLGGEEFGIDILAVQEIRSYEAPTRIAMAPAFIKGVVDLRGVIVPILDLRIKLGMEHANYDSATVTMIVNVSGRVMGAVVDSVSDVVDLSREQIKPAPEFNASVNAGFITGIGVLEHGAERRTLILVDIKELMSGAETDLVDRILQ